jgi:hypothetical protein
VLSKNALWAALLLHFKEHETLVEGPLTNLRQSYMTFARPRRNLASDSRYAFTALARGAWDGRWEQKGGHGSTFNASVYANRRKGRKGGQADSRFDPRYKYDAQELNSSGPPIPHFAPLPSYAGADDLSSVGDNGSIYGGSQYGGSQYGGSQGRRRDHFDLRSQADAASVTQSIDSRRF